ncbi:DUF4328 domain-containing protein [Mycolicibacterium brumae]|uniref:DUF4328 domain-containing protein n=1 Tax=Mycolicibacterium brumae TaxID=85968 RepID=A0A2G5PE89_9MYCO|nr:DUF4328 domain-containing protein [Mycolicibacterium brumae]MCV7191770.1 DUF4328 domain-containing protein [Mycolicibacterium brumae]PIB76343.1 DUF4328 domain-containing protein [Mycolicibacterium brumae]RWA15854.1 hypothetical protein MBRU_09905 [Mycolicibacterium brumae DSM 44177]UWW07076.1 DUF4328 domain-containing protein [Mycolicibacterium brumae]
MIQVCSTCGTRWNVRDRERVWCPRCRGSLLPPTGQTPARTPTTPPPVSSPAAPEPPRSPGLPAGFRWIAVRPGGPPQRRQRSQGLGPTPRYSYIPRWGLTDDIVPVETDAHDAPQRAGSPSVVRLMITLTLWALGVAAGAHLLSYLALVLNRTVLLYPVVAVAINVLTVLTAALAVAAVFTCTMALTAWLIDRRRRAFAELGQTEPRSAAEIWIGCLMPLWNLFWAPTYVVELARADNRHNRLRKPITVWWVLFALSALLSTVVTVISLLAVLPWHFAADTQGVADTTLAAVFAYLLAAATLLAVRRVFDGFEQPVTQRVARRWVMVGAQAEAEKAAA